MDFIKELGMLAIASRLKRLTDRFMRGGSEAYKALSVDFEPRWFTVFYLLQSSDSPLSISEIAQTLKISHPAVIQTTKMLVKKDLVESYQDEKDRRKRQLVVTETGKEMAARLQPIWDDFEAATAEMFDSIGVDMLDIIKKTEDALDAGEISERILKRVRERQYRSIEIIDYEPEYRSHFENLNREWIEKLFELEERDRIMLTYPEEEILRNDGFVLFARVDGQIVGTTALLKVDSDTWEIAKMAVAEHSRGRQIGRKLAETAVDRAKANGGRHIIIRTDNRLRAAVSLYRKLGFRIDRSDTNVAEHYRREDYGILMKLDLA